MTAVVAAIVGISVVLSAQPVQPPVNNSLASVPRFSGTADPRIDQIAAAVAESDGVELRLLAAQYEELEAADTYLSAVGRVPEVRRRAVAQLGDLYSATYASGEDVVVLATIPASVEGALVHEVPHSRRELRALRQEIARTLRRIGLTPAEARAQLVVDRGVWVAVCSPTNVPLDLSDYPATAVHYAGPCLDGPPGSDSS